MTQSQRVAVAVVRPKKLEHFELRAGMLRIGSAAYCDIRLAPDEAASEQVSLHGHDRGLLIRRLSGEFPVRIDGAELSELVVTERTQLSIGAIALNIELLAPEHKQDDTNSVLQRVRQLAMVVAAGAACYAALQREPVDRVFDHSVPTPLLFADGQRSTCPHKEAAAARGYAFELLAEAEAKHERYPYSTRDGVLAVRLYDTASACFQRGADQAAAKEARVSRERLVRALQDDLRAHQVRLEWALERHRYHVAAREVAVISDLLAGRDDAHAVWIAQVARELRALQP